MPSAAALLGFEKSVRDFLGDWSAQTSERYARFAAHRIRIMQRTVVAELHTGLNDPLAEAKTCSGGGGGGTVAANFWNALYKQRFPKHQKNFRAVKKSRRFQQHRIWTSWQNKCRRNRNTKALRALVTYIACQSWARVQRKPEPRFRAALEPGKFAGQAKRR